MRLLESEGAPERRRGGTTMSLVVHVALVAAAVAGTAGDRATDDPDERVPVIVYHAMPEPPATPRPAGPVSRDATSGTPSRPSDATRQVTVPTDVPIGLPPIDIADPGVPLPGTEVTLVGASRPGGEGGFGRPTGGGGYGLPDASGAWDARAVEVAVVPDARNAVPLYPEPLRAGGVTGRVVAEFVVDSTGRVRPGSLVIAQASHPLFESSVRRTVPGFRFTPARVKGRPVAQRVRVPFEFEMGR